MSDIPDRINGQTILASWFNILRTELANAIETPIIVDSDYTATSEFRVIYVDASAGDVQITLPDPTLDDNDGKYWSIRIIARGTNLVTVVSTDNFFDYIFDELTFTSTYTFLGNELGATFQSNGSSVWRIKGNYSVPMLASTDVDDVISPIDPARSFKTQESYFFGSYISDLTEQGLIRYNEGSYQFSNNGGSNWFDFFDGSGKVLETNDEEATVVDEVYVYLDAISNTVTVTLPDAASYEGKSLLAAALSIANEPKLIPAGTDTINSVSEYIFEDVNSPVILSPKNGNWMLVSGSGSGASQAALDAIPGTRLLDGADITINADTTKIDITEATAVFIDTPINPLASTATRATIAAQTIDVTNIATSGITYLSLDSSGTVVQRLAFPTDLDRRSEVFIGAAIHVIPGTVASVQNLYWGPDDNIGNSFEDYASWLGYNTIDGNTITAGTGLEVNKAAGTQLRLGANAKNDHTDPNRVTNLEQLAASLFYTWQDGSTGWNQSVSTELIPDLYDDATGGAAEPSGSVGPSQYTVQPLFLAGESLVLQFGQAIYISLAAAQTSIGVDSIELNPTLTRRAGAELLGYCIVRGNATTWDESTDFVAASFFGSGGGGGGVSDHELLTNLLGGVSGAHYHVTADQNAWVVNAEAGLLNTQIPQVLTADGTIVSTVARLDSSSSDVTATMPDTTTYDGARLSVQAIDLTNTCTLSGDFYGGQTEITLTGKGIADFIATEGVWKHTNSNINLPSTATEVYRAYGSASTGVNKIRYTSIDEDTTDKVISVVNQAVDGIIITSKVDGVVLNMSANSGSGTYLSIIKNDLTDSAGISATFDGKRIGHAESNPGYNAQVSGPTVLNKDEFLVVRRSAAAIAVAPRATLSIVATVDNSSSGYAYETEINGELESYTPTITGFGTPTDVDFTFKRNDDMMEIYGRFTSGTPTAVEAQLGMPTVDGAQTTISTTKNASIKIVGDSGTDTTFQSVLATGGDSYLNIGGAFAKLTPQDGDSVIMSSGTSFSFYARVPIEGWSAIPTTIVAPVAVVTTESYTAAENANFWDGTGNEQNFDHTLLVPAISSSELLEVDETTNSTQTRIVAKKDITLTFNIECGPSLANGADIWDKDGNNIMRQVSSDNGYRTSATVTVDLKVGEFVYGGSLDLTNRYGTVNLHAKEIETGFIAEAKTEIYKYAKKLSSTEKVIGTFDGGSGEQPLYERTYVKVGNSGATFTIADLSTGLRPINSVKYSATEWNVPTAGTVSGSSAMYTRYNDTTGVWDMPSLGGVTVYEGSSFTIQYTKVSESP